MTEWLRGNELETAQRQRATSAARCGSAPIAPILAEGSKIAGNLRRD